jgi:hypothetical protein
MKINELTLMNYATSADAPADKEGWLWKRGDVNKAFQKRYFVLKGNLVSKLINDVTQIFELPNCPLRSYVTHLPNPNVVCVDYVLQFSASN